MNEFPVVLVINSGSSSIKFSVLDVDTCDVLLAGIAEGRTGEDEIIVCSNIGISTNDVAMGQAILTKALEMGIGTRMKL